MSPKIKRALRSAIASSAFRRIFIAGLLAAATAIGVSLDPEIVEAIGDVTVILGCAL